MMFFLHIKTKVYKTQPLFFCLSNVDNSSNLCKFLFSEGGYDLLGRTKDQIRTTEQVNAAMTTCRTLKLDGLVIIGGIPIIHFGSSIFATRLVILISDLFPQYFFFKGVTSNSDAAQLAETFAESKCPTKVHIHRYTHYLISHFLLYVQSICIFSILYI